MGRGGGLHVGGVEVAAHGLFVVDRGFAGIGTRAEQGVATLEPGTLFDDQAVAVDDLMEV